MLHVIYENPTDYPGKFVLRRWLWDGVAEKEPIIVTEKVEEARARIPQGLLNTGRRWDDDPAILEVWV